MATLNANIPNRFFAGQLQHIAKGNLELSIKRNLHVKPSFALNSSTNCVAISVNILQAIASMGSAKRED